MNSASWGMGYLYTFGDVRVRNQEWMGGKPLKGGTMPSEAAPYVYMRGAENLSLGGGWISRETRAM